MTTFETVAVNARQQWLKLHYPDLANDLPTYDRETLARLSNIDLTLLGKRLKEGREAKQIELKALSIRVGCPESYLKCIESGTIRPSIKMLESLADWLDQPVSYLVRNPDEQETVTETK